VPRVTQRPASTSSARWAADGTGGSVMRQASHDACRRAAFGGASFWACELTHCGGSWTRSFSRPDVEPAHTPTGVPRQDTPRRAISPRAMCKAVRLRRRGTPRSTSGTRWSTLTLTRPGRGRTRFRSSRRARRGHRKAMRCASAAFSRKTSCDRG
jgi:hypothetical protein